MTHADIITFVNRNIERIYEIKTYGFWPIQMNTVKETMDYYNKYNINSRSYEVYNNKYYIIDYIKYDDNITNVQKLYYYLLENRELFNIVFYANNNLFNLMIKNAEFPQAKTELVKLRIIVNMIMKNETLDGSTKVLWSNWIKELYWERKKVLHEWYLQYILPF